MGNVLAASVPPPPSPPPPTSGLMPNLEKPESSPVLHTSNGIFDTLENPGTIEDLHKKCKGTLTRVRLVITLPTVSSYIVTFYYYTRT